MAGSEDDICERYVAIGRQFHPTVAWVVVRIAALLDRIRKVFANR